MRGQDELQRGDGFFHFFRPRRTSRRDDNGVVRAAKVGQSAQGVVAGVARVRLHNHVRQMRLVPHQVEGVGDGFLHRLKIGTVKLFVHQVAVLVHREFDAELLFVADFYFFGAEGDGIGLRVFVGLHALQQRRVNGVAAHEDNGVAIDEVVGKLRVGQSDVWRQRGVEVVAEDGVRNFVRQQRFGDDAVMPQTVDSVVHQVFPCCAS